MNYSDFVSGTVGIFLLFLVHSSSGQNDTQCLCLQDVVPENELRTLVRMKPFPDGTGRILFAEKIGVLWIYSEDFVRQPEAFANFSHLVDAFPLDCAFQGVAFHPNFPEDRRIFVNFNKRDLFGDYSTLRQYSVYPDNLNLIDLDTEVILIEKNRRSNGSSAHSGGEVFFNNDGYLYVVYGDGSQGDPLYVSQNRGEFRGKMLRLDIDNVPEGQAYGIPPDNPFIDEEGTLPEIYALGFRQPWTISVDHGDPETGEGAGRIFLADCGQRSFEEINLVVKGGNYGWSSREGFQCYRYKYCNNIGPEEYPIAAYRHDMARLLGWCAISGHVYRGDKNPGLSEAYIHGDSGTRRNLYVMRESPEGHWSHDELPLCDLETCDSLGLANFFLANILSFGIDSYGIFLACLVHSSCGQNDTRCLCLQDVVPENELRTIIRMKPLPDGTGRILIAEMIGVLWIYSEDFVRQPEPFANFSHLIDSNALDSSFQGVAFHPRFPEDGRIFVTFNQMDLFGDYGTLRQYSIYPDNLDLIDLGSEVVLIDKNRKSNGSSDHSGGEVFFNTDGYLYVVYGDGTQGDPLNVSQNKSDFRGKMLRLDINNVPEGQAYGIPPDNPFIDEEGTLPEIYALGFRQPWTISVDYGDPETGEEAGRIFLADCGQRSYEEINLVVKGGNYGWSSREGFQCYKYKYCNNIGPEEYPIAAYRHDMARLLGWCAIGGHVYRGDINPGLNEAYIHGDSGTKTNLYVMRESPEGKWSHDELPLCDLETCDSLGMTNFFLANLLSFGLDSYGEIYLLSSTTPDVGFESSVQRLVDPETFVA